MDKKPALLLSFLLTILIANNYYLIQALQEPKHSFEPVQIKRVIDGDSLVLEDGRKIRLLNINTPEKNIPTHNLSVKYLKQFENQTLLVQITSTDKYQRSLARLYTSQGAYLNLDLVTLGFSSKFLVDSQELGEFNKAENQAISQNLGIWKKSQYKGCFSIDINPEEEFLLIENLCLLSMKGWKIKDESRKIFTFPDVSSGKVILNTGPGNNTLNSLFWNSKTNIWNNNRDTVYLFDSEGGLAYHESYGY